MQSFKNLSDLELHEATLTQAKREQSATLELLFHLSEVKRRRLYGTRGYPSLWEYIRSLGYSESGASERLRAMELLVSEPEVVEEKLRTNAITLTTASQIQTYVRKMEKHTGVPVCASEKRALIEESSSLSKREVETLLIAKTPRSFGQDLRPRKYA